MSDFSPDPRRNTRRRRLVTALGRFLQVDPIEGVGNDYVWPTAPFGKADLTGRAPSRSLPVTRTRSPS